MESITISEQINLIISECIHKLSTLSKSKTTYSQEDLVNVEEIFSILSKHHLSATGLVEFWFRLQDNLLSLHVLWQLQHHNFIQFTSYIFYNINLIPKLSESFEEQIWCQDDSITLQCSETVAGLLAVLVNLGVHTLRDICRPGQELLTLVIEKFVDRLLWNTTAPEEPVSFLPQLLNNTTLITSRLQVFCFSLLKAMIYSAPQRVTFEEALQDQAKSYTAAKTSPSSKQVFREVLSRLSEEDIVNELSRIISSKEQFNWCWFLTTVSIFVATSTRAESLKGAVEKWLSQACLSKDVKMLSAALLCARQCCAETSQIFGSYSTWFGGLHIRPASSFTFFFNFLSQLVPHEPVLNLKIHVNKVPSAPANCHGVIADYAALAKTRLADLNQTTDYVGLFGEYTTTEQEGRESDVAKVVTNFKQTKEIMKIVLEASVFRRQFYEKIFLTELLKDDNPQHVEFIEKLYSIGKIPHGLYNQWRLLHF